MINPDAVAVVYLNRTERFLQSSMSNFEVMYKESATVAYIEDLGVLCCGSDSAYYSREEYIADVMSSDFTEMTYKEYLTYYKQKLNDDNPNAPVLNDPYEAQNPIQNPVLKNLSDKGITYRIF